MRATAIAHPNVAIIKYWGKRDSTKNLPAVDSLSLTLGALGTETTVEFDTGLKKDTLVLNGREKLDDQARLTACLDSLRKLSGERSKALITSRNDFPSGAGLASSASGYAALVTAAAAAMNLEGVEQDLLKIARIGSGSAPRSMFGGIALLRNLHDDTVCEQVLAPADWPLSVIVAVTTESSKAVSSRDGMEQSRLTSPYYQSWLASHPDDLEQALDFVRQRDFFALAELAEYNCLKMHAVMMTTRPALMYWSPGTLACLHALWELRRQGVPVFFTIDAGPQVKAVCLPEASVEVARVLEGTAGVLRVIRGDLGEGARLVSGSRKVSADA